MKHVFWVCSYFFFITVQAQDIPKIQSEVKVTNLTIAAPEIRPFVYTNDKGENDGLLIDTTRKLNDSGNFNISVKIMPWARALKEVKEGRINALMPTVYTKERATFLSFPKKPLINFYGSKIFKRVDDNFVYRSIASIDKNKILVKVRSTSVNRESEKAFREASTTFVETTRLEDAFKMLIYGHADLLVADSVIANTTINQMGINDSVIGFLLTNSVGSSFLAFSNKYAQSQNIDALMDEINLINDPESYHHLSQKK
jgi:polar amino acid transport system substrate-binding protein